MNFKPHDFVALKTNPAARGKVLGTRHGSSNVNRPDRVWVAWAGIQNTLGHAPEEVTLIGHDVSLLAQR